MFKIPEIIFRYFSFCLSLVAALSISIQAAKPLEGSLGKSKEHFLENKGQINYSDGKPADNVCFVLDRGETKIFILRDGGIAYQTERKHYPKGFDAMWKPNMGFQNPYHLDSMMQLVQTETYRMDMKLLGANLKAEIIKAGESLDYIHYYNHNVLQVHHYERLLFKEIYPGIDWIIYTTEQGFKYDFLVKPGANVGQIKMQFTGQEELKLDRQGNLLHGNRLARFIEEKPVSYQGKRDIQTNFILKDSIVEFEVSNYDKTQPLTIDPNRIWGSYYGGENWDAIFSLKADTLGFIYCTGITQSNLNISNLGFQQYQGGALDAFIFKIDSNGIKVWGSYFGGLKDDIALKICLDKALNLIVCGYTSSSNAIFTNGFQQNLNGNFDGFVLKTTNSGQLLWSTYIGGNGLDQCSSISTDSFDNIYVVGVGSNPLPYNQNLPGGSQDGFISKLDSNGNPIWSRFFGGAASDALRDVICDSNGDVLVAGFSSSNNNISLNGYQPTLSGNIDAALAKYSTFGNPIWSTYYGGMNDEFGYSIAVDNSNNVYLCGESNSTNIPGTNVNSYQSSNTSNPAGFIVNFGGTGQPIWASFVGGNSVQLRLNSIKVYGQSVLIAGEVVSNDNLNGWQGSFGGGIDGFIGKFSTQGLYSWSSYYGGQGDDTIYEIESFNNSFIYSAGATQSLSNITSDTSNNFLSGIADAFIAKFKSCPTLNLNLGSPSSYCIGDTIFLSSQGASIYAWTGPAGFSSNLSQPSILNAQLGMTGYYKIEATDAFGCQSKDSVLVIVHPLPLVAITGPASYCEGDTIQLLGQGAINYSWTLPSGSSIPTDSLTILNSLASNSGTVILFGTDSNQCSNTDSLAIIVTPYPNAQVNNIGSICPGASFTLLAEGGTHFLWSGPNGFSSSISNPTLANVSQINAGIYQVIVSQGIGCSDTAFVPVFLHTNPVITATNTGPYCSGDSIQAFSSGAHNYSWSGPNGFAASGSSIVIPQSQPIDSGEYYVIGTDSNGCSDTTSTQILVVANPIVQINSSLDEEFCQGLSTLLQATGAQNYTWNTGQVNPSIWVQQSGTYNCIGIDSNGCSSLSNSLLFNVVPVPSWLTPPQNLVELPGQTATLVAIAANANFYQWESLISGFFQPLQDTGQYSGTQTQVLSVANLNTHNHGQQFRCIASNNLCQDTSSVAVLFLSGNQSNEKELSSSLVYPNPATTLLHLKIPLATPFNYSVKDQLGRLVLKSISQNKDLSISIESWPTGWYTFTAGDINILFGKIN